ncbi:hypothetical protein ACJJTC_017546 [Scirpophaga incertulas]
MTFFYSVSNPEFSNVYDTDFCMLIPRSKTALADQRRRVEAIESVENSDESLLHSGNIIPIPIDSDDSDSSTESTVMYSWELEDLKDVSSDESLLQSGNITPIPIESDDSSDSSSVPTSMYTQELEDLDGMMTTRHLESSDQSSAQNGAHSGNTMPIFNECFDVGLESSTLPSPMYIWKLEDLDDGVMTMKQMKISDGNSDETCAGADDITLNFNKYFDPEPSMVFKPIYSWKLEDLDDEVDTTTHMEMTDQNSAESLTHTGNTASTSNQSMNTDSNAVAMPTTTRSLENQESGMMTVRPMKTKRTIDFIVESLANAAKTMPMSNESVHTDSNMVVMPMTTGTPENQERGMMTVRPIKTSHQNSAAVAHSSNTMPTSKESGDTKPNTMPTPSTSRPLEYQKDGMMANKRQENSVEPLAYTGNTMPTSNESVDTDYNTVATPGTSSTLENPESGMVTVRPMEISHENRASIEGEFLEFRLQLEGHSQECRVTKRLEPNCYYCSRAESLLRTGNTPPTSVESDDSDSSTLLSPLYMWNLEKLFNGMVTMRPTETLHHNSAVIWAHSDNTTQNLDAESSMVFKPMYTWKLEDLDDGVSTTTHMEMSDQNR